MGDKASSENGWGRRLLRWVTAPVRPLAALKRHPRWTGLSTLSAVFIVLSFVPYDVYPLAFIAYVPLLAVATRVRPRQAFGWGLWCGALITGLGFYFIVPLLEIFGGMPLLVAVFLHLLFSLYHGLGIAGFAALTSWLVRRGWSVALVVPFAYVASEMVARELYIFPWYLGNCAYKFTAFIQSADLFGGFGLTALMALVNGTLYVLVDALWKRRRNKKAAALPRRALIVTAVLLVLNLGYGIWRIGDVEAVMVDAPHLRIGLVEADIGPFEKRDPERLLNNLLIHQQLSARLEREGVDLIVWPETSATAPAYTVSREPTTDLVELEASSGLIDLPPRDVSWFRPSDAPLVGDYRQDRRDQTPAREMYGIQRGFRTPLLFGVLTAREPTADEAAGIPPHPRRPPLVYYNTAVLLDAEGRVLATYDKSVLLVLGEFVPLSHWLYRSLGFNFYALVPAAGDVSAGEQVAVMELPLVLEGEDEPLVVRIGAMICYEDIIAEYGLELADLAPNLFINIINDGWFLETSAARHHMSFSVLRAVEHRIPLVRSTNTGISTFIDPVGRITKQTRITGAETLVEEVPVMPPPATVYAAIGDVVGWAAWVGVFGLWLRSRRRKS